MTRSGIVLSLALLVGALWPQPARAQQPLTDVLSFLLINRSIPTGDFNRDEQAAAATRDAIAGLLTSELNTLPISSPASGFTYRLDPTIGASVRSSTSFGPLFLERSLTSGKRRTSFTVAFTEASFHTIDGRNLRDGTLVATASRLSGDAAPFDSETLTLRMSSRTMTVSGLVGVTDRLDVSAALPFVRVTFTGERIDTYRGTALTQALATGTASGPGDLVIRAKYNVHRQGGGGLAVAGEARLATGDSGNLLGGGRNVIAPSIIGSIERGRIAVHGNLGYAMGGPSRELAFGAAVTFAGTSRLTLVGEFLARRLGAGGRLIEVVEPHPQLIGIETVRLSATPQSSLRALIVGGVRWNAATNWLVNASVLRPVSTAGLNARWVGSVTIDYSLGG